MSAAGEDVTLVARGAVYDAMCSRGVILEGPATGNPAPIKVRAVRPGEEKPPYDLIFVTLKSHQLPEAAQHVRTLGDANTTFVFPQNGLPWWYFEGLDSKYRGTPLKTLDPEGVLARTFDTAQIVGGVAFKPTDTLAPAHIRLADSPADSLTIGEVDNRLSDRLQTIAAITGNAGWKGAPVPDIRKVKWTKLLSNAVWNMLGVITQATPTQAAGYAPTAALALAMTREVIALAEAAGCALAVDAEKLVADVVKRVSLPTSTLQDARAGRTLELGALSDVLLEISALTGVAAPNLSVVSACANMVNRRIIEDGAGVRLVKVT